MKHDPSWQIYRSDSFREYEGHKLMNSRNTRKLVISMESLPKLRLRALMGIRIDCLILDEVRSLCNIPNGSTCVSAKAGSGGAKGCST